MKLSDRYDPETCRLKDNEFYTVSPFLFQRLFAPPPQPDSTRLTYNETGYSYLLAENERRFYAEDYLLLSTSLDASRYHELFPRGQRIGEAEAKVLDLLLSDTRYNSYLLGGVGAGKTTLLRYVLLYLLPQSSQLKSQFFPIFIPLDKYNNKFPREVDSKEFSAIFRDQILRPNVSKLIEGRNSVTSTDNDKFWVYLQEQDDFYRLRNDYNAVLDQYGNVEVPEARAKLREDRNKYRYQRDFALYALRFMARERDQMPILVIDNVDQFSREICLHLANELFDIRASCDMKTIAAMRTRTFEDIRNDMLNDTINPHKECPLKPPDVKQFTQLKIEQLRKLLREADSDASRHVKLPSGMRLQVHDAAIEANARMLLHPASLSFLDAASQCNLRRWNALADIYFRSGLLEENADQIKTIFQKTYLVEGQSKTPEKFPFWIPLVSIITRNHRIFFSSHRNDDNRNLVLNMFCNGESRHNTSFVRLQLLSFIERHVGISAESVAIRYCALFPAENRVEAHRSLLHALRRMINCRLIDSTSRFVMTSDDEVKHLGALTVTTYGSTWLSRWVQMYEVVAYMKDDVWFNGDIPAGIKSCLDETNLEGRLASSAAFLDYLLRREMNFIRYELGSDDHSRSTAVRSYLKDFVIDRKSPLYSVRICRGVLNFAKERRGENNVVGKLEELVAEGSGYEAALLKEYLPCCTRGSVVTSTRRIVSLATTAVVLLSVAPLYWDDGLWAFRPTTFTQEWYKSLTALVELLVTALFVDYLIKKSQLAEAERLAVEHATKAVLSLLGACNRFRAWVEGKASMDDRAFFALEFARAAALCRNLAEVEGLTLTRHSRDRSDDLYELAPALEGIANALLRDEFGQNDPELLRAAARATTLIDGIRARQSGRILIEGAEVP